MRPHSKLSRAFIALFACISAVAPSWAQTDVRAETMRLVEGKQFDSALRLLAAQDAQTRAGYEHRFLRARVESWSGRYSEARRTLNELMSESPNNADLLVAMGNLEYYQGHLSAARKNYVQALELAPNYTDASRGLSNIDKAEAAARGTVWRIDGGVGLSSFKRRDQDDWDEEFLRVEYAPSEIAYHASATRYNRFGETNVQVMAGISDAVRGGWDWGLEAGFTPDALFRPELSLGARVGKAVKTEGGTTLYPEMRYRFDNYDASDIHTVQPGLTAYLENGVILSARAIATLQSREKDQIGWLAEGRVPVSDRLQLRAGFANAPEAINGVAVTTQSLFGGATYSVSETLDLHINAARDDRENSYIRNSVNVGFTVKH